MKNRKSLRILDLWPLIYANANFARIITPLKSMNCSRHSYLLLPLLSLFSTLSFGLQIAEAQSLSPPKPYTLQIGDAISVTVEGYPEYSKQIVVRLDGYISYPLIGEIKAEGLTIPEIESEIVKGLTEELGQPRVFATLVRSKQRSVYVWGAVKLADRYFFETEEIYLSQALALAGGPDYGRAKLTEIQIWRDGQIYQIVNLTQLRDEANQTDIPLQADDVVHVPNLLQQRPIMVTGAVLEQGLYEIENSQIHAVQALMMAGGPTQDLADLASAEIIKSTGQRIPINLENPLDGNTTVGIAILEPGDMLYIPNAYEEEKVSIMGAVARPGQYQIKKPVDMIEALALAGGWLEDRANLKKALIIRSNGEKEQINLLELLESGSPDSGPFLSPGDRLQVPNRIRINWSALLTVTSAATLIYNIVR